MSVRTAFGAGCLVALAGLMLSTGGVSAPAKTAEADDPKAAVLRTSWSLVEIPPHLKRGLRVTYIVGTADEVVVNNPNGVESENRKSMVWTHVVPNYREGTYIWLQIEFMGSHQCTLKASVRTPQGSKSHSDIGYARVIWPTTS